MMNPAYFIHIVKSFGLHIFFGIVVVLSFNFTGPEENPEKEPEVSAIDAVVIDQVSLETQIKKIKTEQANKKAAEERRVKELEDRARAAKNDLAKLNKQKENSKKAADDAKRKAREEKRKADLAKKERQKREREAERAKKAAADAKRKKEAEEKAAAEAKRKKEAEEKAYAEAERKRKEKAEKERKEKERREREAKEKAMQEKLLQEQLAAEQARRKKARNKVVLTEVQKYKALITSKIQQNLILDEKMKGQSCRINIKLASSGLVLSVKILSGDAYTCKAAERAILKATTLPVSKELDVFEQLKDINLTVEPEF